MFIRKAKAVIEASRSQQVCYFLKTSTAYDLATRILNDLRHFLDLNIGHQLISSKVRVRRKLIAEIPATRKKMMVEIAVARPKS